MGESKHTPGPWTAVLTGRRERNIRMVEPGSEGDGFSIRAVSPFAPVGQRVAFVPADYIRNDDREGVSAEAIATAHLIAAAPRMLEALEAVERIGETDWGSGSVLLEQVRAAIKAATGEGDWIDEIFDAAAGTPVGQFAVVVRADGQTSARAVYTQKTTALGQATKQAGASGNGYVVQRTSDRLIIWLSADTTLRARAATGGEPEPDPQGCRAGQF